jgi:transcriptional regulator with XRE-family HTH domain
MSIIVDPHIRQHAQSTQFSTDMTGHVDHKGGHMNWKRELGRQIKQERESAGLTQADLANELDLCRQMISRYESGHDAPAIDVLVELARILDIEFQVKGIIVKFERGYKGPRLLHRQLKLEYEKPRRFDRAQIEITPSEGKILIKAEIPA